MLRKIDFQGIFLALIAIVVFGLLALWFAGQVIDFFSGPPACPDEFSYEMGYCEREAP